MGDGGRAEAGPTVPQCSPGPGPAGPGRQEKPRLRDPPGLRLRPRFVWFRGWHPPSPPLLGASRLARPPHGSLFAAGGGQRVGFPPLSAPGSIWAPPFLVVGGGDGWLRRAVRLAGELVFPLLCGLPLALEEGERERRSGPPRWLGNLCGSLQVTGQGEPRPLSQPQHLC